MYERAPGGIELEPEHQESHAVRSARILVVEDEHLVALDIQRGLARIGHLAEVAYSGEAAIAQVSETRFDLVLMDIKLGGKLDGIEAAQTIRAIYDVPIIYLTAYADNQTLERARLTEPYGYVLKPFQERELKAAIGMALQRHGTDRYRWEQHDLQQFLAEASAKMAATLDYQAVILGATELLVPRYADWCTLRLNETGNSVPAFSYTLPDEPSSLAIPEHGEDLIAQVLRNGRPYLMPHVSELGWLGGAVGSEHTHALRELGARSMVCVPLLARGQVLGALVMVSGRTRPRYSSQDLLFFEDFAHRLGVALDNALLYRNAERAIGMRDDVLAIVSHDLRTPLGTVLLHSEKLKTCPETAKAGEAIARAAQRMNRLIGDLLDASALNAGKLTLECRVHSINSLISEAVEMFRSQADARGVTLTEVSPESPVYVSCDHERIGQVLANLVGNAVKFTPRGGQVLVSAARTVDGVHVEVRDTGPGIAESQIPHLFDRFWRAKAQRQGAGLGLFIAHGIVASHGSTLQLDSTLGEGSRFYFVLPEIVS